MKILIFGDSHSVYFNSSQELKDMNESFKGIETKVITIPGATINGFGQRKSTLDVKSKFVDEFKDFNPDFICFALGQVDIELGLYYRKVVKGDKIDNKTFIDDLCETYFSAIIEVANDLGIHLSKICIKGINLSVLTKSRQKAIIYTSRIITENIKEHVEVVRYRGILKNVYPSNLERYSNHIYFNSVIKKLAEGQSSYFDINDLLEDPSVKGEVNPMYIPAKEDHHLLDSLFLRKIHLDRLLYQLLNI